MQHHTTTLEHSGEASPRSASAGATAAVLLAFALPATGLVAVSPATMAAARAPGADGPALVAGMALLLAWALVARLAVTAAAVLVSHVPGVVGSTSRRIAAAASPALLRALVRVAAGTVVAAAPMSLTTAALADPGPVPTSVSTSTGSASTVRVLPAGTVPLLDRVEPDVSAQPGDAPASPAARPAAGTPRTVVVRSGDTLWGIADRALPPGHGDADVAKAWPRWYAANRTVVGTDPGAIRPGEVLRPPP